MNASHDVVIVGGGAVGAAAAWELARTRRKVLLLEQGGDLGQAWRAAAGMLAPQIEAQEDDPLLDLGLCGRELYEETGPSLREATGIDIGLWQEGIARVAFAESEVGALRARVAWQRQQGYLCDWLDPAEVHDRYPWLPRTHGALWAPRDGALDPIKLVTAYREAARRLGATLVEDRAVSLERDGDRITGVVGRERYPAAEVVIAGGAWSGRLEGLPRPLSVEPVRGQMAAFSWPAGIGRAIVYHQDSYLVARGTEAVVGSTMEHVGFDANTTEAGIAGLAQRSRRLCPPLNAEQIVRTWAGLRPGTPDGLPIIGREPSVKGLICATGHGRNGILLAGITGVVVRELIAGEPTFEALAVTAPERFWGERPRPPAFPWLTTS